LLFGAYIFRIRHRFFDRDPNVNNDIPAIRHFKVEVVLIPLVLGDHAYPGSADQFLARLTSEIVRLSTGSAIAEAGARRAQIL
jgi:hypothetical protein